jgi:hypothetical protein
MGTSGRVALRPAWAAKDTSAFRPEASGRVRPCADGSFLIDGRQDGRATLPEAVKANANDLD